jgi:hypothetical protein
LHRKKYWLHCNVSSSRKDGNSYVLALTPSKRIWETSRLTTSDPVPLNVNEVEVLKAGPLVEVVSQPKWFAIARHQALILRVIFYSKIGGLRVKIFF